MDSLSSTENNEREIRWPSKRPVLSSVPWRCEWSVARTLRLCYRSIEFDVRCELDYSDTRDLSSWKNERRTDLTERNFFDELIRCKNDTSTAIYRNRSEIIVVLSRVLEIEFWVCFMSKEGSYMMTFKFACLHVQSMLSNCEETKQKNERKACLVSICWSRFQSIKEKSVSLTTETVRHSRNSFSSQVNLLLLFSLRQSRENVSFSLFRCSLMTSKLTLLAKFVFDRVSRRWKFYFSWKRQTSNNWRQSCPNSVLCQNERVASSSPNSTFVFATAALAWFAMEDVVEFDEVRHGSQHTTTKSRTVRCLSRRKFFSSLPESWNRMNISQDFVQSVGISHLGTPTMSKTDEKHLLSGVVAETR